MAGRIRVIDGFEVGNRRVKYRLMVVRLGRRVFLVGNPIHFELRRDKNGNIVCFMDGEPLGIVTDIPDFVKRLVPK